jgi:hypothetical protein
MPKARFQPQARGMQGRSQRIRFKIGGRNSTRSALAMSDQELLEAYTSKSTRGRDRNKMRQVVQLRGLEVA